MKKKQEVILLNEVVTLEDFFKINEINIFPLCIFLTDEQSEKFNKLKELPDFKVISELYFRSAYNESYLYLNSYKLRDKIDCGEVFVAKFIDKDEKIKNVDFIAPAFGYDLDAPKIVFRKSPRLIFKKADHFSMDKKYEGQDLQSLCFNVITEYQKKLS